MTFNSTMERKYGNIISIIDIEHALKDENFMNEFSSEFSIIIETSIDSYKDDLILYNVNDATIVGLYTKLYKYLKLLLRAYKEGEYDLVVLISRPLYEAFVLMKYLILKGEESQINYRLVSYKNQYKKIQELEGKGGIGKVMLSKFHSDIESDGFTIEDFEKEDSKQKVKKWALDSKNFYNIHKEVENTDTYPYSYGMISEVIHSGWRDIRQLHLNWKDKKAVPRIEFYRNTDIRIIVPIFSIMIEATEQFLTWHKRESEIVFLNEHKRINQLLSLYILDNYEKNPDKYFNG